MNKTERKKDLNVYDLISTKYYLLNLETRNTQKYHRALMCYDLNLKKKVH